jgi:thiol-disulfide isomerase/thioredoxin
VTCPACDKEIPELEKLTEAYGGDELRLMLINVDPTAGSIGKYFGEYRPVSEVYHGSDDLVEAYGVYRIPHLVLYTAEGEKFLDQAGFFPSKMLQSLVEHALGRGKMGSS